MKYDVTYKCGHTGTIELLGTASKREYALKSAETSICPECQKKKNMEVLDADISKGYCALTGSEAQVSWAATIRHRKVEAVEDFLGEDLKEVKNKVDTATFEFLNCGYDRIVNILKTEKAGAAWWITHRDSSPDSIARLIIEEYKLYKDDSQPENTSIEAEKEATIEPENKKRELVVEVAVDGSTAVMTSPKDESLIKLAKSYNFRWNNDLRRWERKETFSTGSARDRAAEIGNACLLAGFPIKIFDDELRKAAINAAFEPEHKRWISVVAEGTKYAGYFSIKWERGAEEIYNLARSLPKSRWDSPSVVVPQTYYKEVEDFAEMHDFRLSPGAEKAIQKAKEEAANREVVSPVSAKNKEYENHLKDILESDRSVIEDLKDD